jgi:hypothetical protein
MKARTIKVGTATYHYPGDELQPLRGEVLQARHTN